MSNAKTLEMIIRAKDETSGPMRRAGQGSQELVSHLKSVRRELVKVEQLRAATRSTAQNQIAQSNIRALEREVAMGNQQAKTQLEILRINQQYTAERQQILAITRSELAGTEQRRQAYQGLIALEQQRTRAIAAAAKARQDEALQAQRITRQTVQKGLGAQRVAYLQQEANLGNTRARQELEILQINRRYQDQQRAMLGIMYNQQASDRQRAAAKVQLIRLEEQRRRAVLAVAQAEHLATLEAQRGARAKMLGSARAVAGGALGGAAASFGSVMPGLAGGAILAGGGPAAAAAASVGAVTYTMAQAVKTAAQFEHAMARVRALTRATGRDWQDLQDEAQRLGATTIYTANQVAEAMSNMALAGYSVKQILTSTEPTLRLAAAGQMDIAQATDIVVKIMAGMRIEASKLPEVVDMLVKGMTTANTDLVQLGYAMSYVGPAAQAVGRDLAETTAVIQLFSNAGIQGEMAGTTLRQILISLLSPSAMARKELAGLGVDLLDTSGNMLPLAQIVDNLNSKLAGLGDGQKLDILGRIFEARSLSGVNVLLKATGDELRRMETELNNAGGTAQRIADVQLDTLTGSVIRMKSAWESLMITVGDTSALRSGVDGLTWFINQHQQNINEYGALGAVGPMSAWGVAKRWGMNDTSHQSATLQRRMDEMRKEQEAARDALASRASSAGRSAVEQERFEAMRETANRLADATLNADALRSTMEKIRQQSEALLDPSAKYLQQLRDQAKLLEEIRQQENADDAKRQSAKEALLAIQKEIARVEGEQAKVRRGILYEEEGDRLRDLVRAGGTTGREAQKKIAAREIEEDMRRRYEELLKVRLDPAATDQQRHDATMRMRDLIDNLPARQKEAADKIDADAAKKRADSLRTIDDQLQAGRLALLREQAAMGDKAAEAEARRLEITIEYQRRRMAILDLLKQENLTQEQRDEALRQLGQLDQSEAAARVEAGRQKFERRDALDASLVLSRAFKGFSLTGQESDPNRQTAANTKALQKELADVKAQVTALVELLRSRGESIPYRLDR